MRRHGLVEGLVLAVFLQLGLLLPSCYATRGTGKMTTVPIDCDTVRAVQCSADTSSDDFVGLTIYDTSNPDENLVSVQIRSRKCETGTQPASCVINDDQKKVALNVVLADLKRGEERQYRCNANYFNRVARTETFYANVSVPKRGTTMTVTQSTTTAFGYGGISKNLQGSKSTKAPGVKQTATAAWTTESSRSTPSEAGNRESNDSKGNAVNVAGIAIGAAVTFVVMGTIMAIWRCRHKCPALCMSCSSPLPSRPTSQHVEWETCAVDDDLPPELPARNPGNDYRRKSSLPGMPGPVQEVPEPNGEYLTPVFKAPPMPTDPPEKHNFRQPQESGSTHYEVVN